MTGINHDVIDNKTNSQNSYTRRTTCILKAKLLMDDVRIFLVLFS